MHGETLESRDAVVIRLADTTDRDKIYKIRHDVYAHEMQQHRPNEFKILKDELDEYNVYLVAELQGEIVGFISLTPPGRRMSVDKYFKRSNMPFAVDEKLFELRLLTIVKHYRAQGRSLAAVLLITSALWAEAHGGTRVVATGHDEVLDFYRSLGAQPTGLKSQSGALVLELVTSLISDLKRLGHKQLERTRAAFRNGDYVWSFDFHYE